MGKKVSGPDTGPVTRRVNGWHKGTVEVLPSGSIRWAVRVTYPDGTHDRRRGTVRTKTEAQKAIIDAQKEAAAGQRAVSTTLTVGQMVTEFMQAKAATWSARTAWNNDALYTRHIVPELAHLKAAGVDARRLRAYFAWLSEKRDDPATGKTRPPLHYSGQRQIHVLLSGAYKRAIADGLLRDNPAQYARPLSPSKGGTVKVEKLKHFTPDDLGKFIDAALQDRGALVLAFLALTGLRIGEALALTWGDVQEDPDVPGQFFVQVSKTRSEFEGQYYTGAAKTAAGVRRVYLSPDALAVVQDMRGRVTVEARQVARYQGEGTVAGAPVFAAVDGRPMRQDVARAVMRRTCQAAGVPLLSPHALRHSVGTALIARGNDPVSVSKHLGHVQVSTTLNIYAHALPDKLRGLGITRASLSPVKEDAAPPAASRVARGPSTPRRKAGPRRKG